MQIWPGHVDDFDMEASRMANMLHAHVPLAMSLCHVDYANLKMQSSLSNHMYSPAAFEGILELRKEKSRDAARSRRGKENYEFYELAKLLPLPTAITSQLDKASIIRLTISYLKLRDFSSHGDPPWNRDSATKSNKTIPQQCRNSLSLAQDVFEVHQGTHILQSLDGFAFALSNDGRFLYISETVSIYLGLSQVEMAGSSIFEYIHSSDHRELAEQLGLNSPKSTSFPSPRSGTSDDGSSTPNPPRSSTPTMSERVSIMSPNPSKGYDRCFCIRMKSTLTKRGVHFKSSGYRVVQIVAHLRPQISYPVAQKQLPPLLGLVGMAIALPPPTITELIIDNDMFITRLSPQFKVTYCEPRICDMMDITSEDLVNKNLYDHCHAEDLQKLNKAHTDLLNKGQVLTDYYRLMNRHGGYVWIQTCATIICNAKNAEEQNIIAINYVLSGVEYAGCVMNLNQFRILSKSDPDILTRTDSQSDLTPDSDRNAVSISHSVDERSFVLSKSSTKTPHHRMGMTPDNGTSNVDFDSFGSPPGHVVDDVIRGTDDDRRGSRRTDFGPGDRSGAGVGGKTTAQGGTVDPKNSRRKMEKPRKRKRMSDGDTGTKVPKVGTDSQAYSKLGLTNTIAEERSNESPTSKQSSNVADEMSVAVGRNSSEYPGRTTGSPTPEDLSTVRPGTTGPPEEEDEEEGDECSSLRLQTDSPGLISGAGVVLGAGRWVGALAQNGAMTYAQDATAPTAGAAQSSSSVLELEEAMNKHLPAQTSSGSSSSSDHPSSSSVLGGYGGHPVVGLPGKHSRSTIQWIGGGGGAATVHHSGGGGGSQSDISAASSLLRSLYPNRESVIRTNIYSSRPPQYYDIQNALLTPPGASGGGGVGGGPPVDLYRDPSFTVSLLNHSKDSNNSSSGSYGLTNCYSASSPVGLNGIAVGMSSSAVDAYAMTPPSSVSPQENYMSQFLDRAAMQQYCVQGRENALAAAAAAAAAATMPLRPQAYALPSHGTAYEHPVPYHAGGGYYSSNVGMAAYNYVTGNSNASHYRDAMKNANSW